MSEKGLGPTLLVATVGKESASFPSQPAPKGLSYMDLALAGFGIISLFGSLRFMVQGFGLLATTGRRFFGFGVPSWCDKPQLCGSCPGIWGFAVRGLGLLDLQGSSSRGGSDLGCRGESLKAREFRFLGPCWIQFYIFVINKTLVKIKYDSFKHGPDREPG